MVAAQGSLLVVDDNEMNRDMLSRRLIRRGFDADVAENGFQALDMIQKNNYDLILLDIMMPELTGIDILKILREKHSMSELPIIMVSAKDQSSDIIEALKLGANDYINKPIDFPVALARIRTQLTRKQAELALKISEAKNRAILEALPDTLFRLTKEGQLLDLRPSLHGACFFHNDKEQLPDDLGALLPARAAQEIEQTMFSVLERGQPMAIEFDCHAGSQTTYFEARIVPSNHDDVLVLIRDITERKRIELMRTEFISLLTHDVREGLTSIRGSLGLLAGANSLALPPQVRTLVSIAHNNSERLLRLIADILDIEAIEAGQMQFHFEPVNLSQLLLDSVDLFRQNNSEHFRGSFEFTHFTENLFVYADKERLSQVISTLLFNAVKFSPSDSSILIALQRFGKFIRFAITDAGPSIPDTFRDRIFQKFAQIDTSLSRQQGDAALGLSLSKAIIEKLSGIIGFEPSTTGGNTFYFELLEWKKSSP